ncbi:MAG: GTP cyclohydrolase FolE2 [Burkholderiaceae bacterium]|nr:GTP cyclohydrolase FolE2 [Burkholderiaceae bacterium]
MNARDTMFLPDVQSAADRRNLAITRVGIKGLRHPLLVASASGAQPTVATADMYVALPAHQKGTHMSRFIEVLAAHRRPLSVSSLRELLAAMLTRLEAEAGTIEIRFPFFITKRAPVSGVASLLDYEVTLRGEQHGARVKTVQQVSVPVTSLCPCSKKISDYGAHNQRAAITIALELAEDLPLEQQVRFAEDAASSEIWSLLKRPDEKYVTERAYENPKFVEDIVRDIALALNRDDRVLAYTVASENFESIHNHSAFAAIEHDKRAPAVS